MRSNGRAPGDTQQVSQALVRVRGINLFVGIGQSDAALVLQCEKQRVAIDRASQQIGEFLLRPVTYLERDRLALGKPHSFQANDRRGWGKPQAGGNLRFISDDGGGDDVRSCRESKAGHLFVIPEELVELDSGRSDKRACAAAAFHNSVSCQFHQGVPRRHQAHLMRAGQLPFRRHEVPRFQLAGIDPATDRALDPFVGRFFRAAGHHSHV